MATTPATATGPVPSGLPPSDWRRSDSKSQSEAASVAYPALGEEKAAATVVAVWWGGRYIVELSLSL
jgi:uncharacterized protein YfaP (DUF2135 family)